jgi:hypothetical protein
LIVIDGCGLIIALNVRAFSAFSSAECRYILNVDVELKDILLRSSMVLPRPYAMQPLAVLGLGSGLGSGLMGGGVGGGVGGESAAVACVSVARVAASLVAAAHEHLGQGASVWAQYYTSHPSAAAMVGSGELLLRGRIVEEQPFLWFNDHPMSFNHMSWQMIVCKTAVALCCVGFAKVVFKLLPSFVFGALNKRGLIKDPPPYDLDCFHRPVPALKSYVVEVPVR